MLLPRTRASADLDHPSWEPAGDLAKGLRITMPSVVLRCIASCTLEVGVAGLLQLDQLPELGRGVQTPADTVSSVSNASTCTSCGNPPRYPSRARKPEGQSDMNRKGAHGCGNLSKRGNHLRL